MNITINKSIFRILILFSFTCISCGGKPSYNQEEEILRDAIKEVNSKVEASNDLMLSAFKDDGKILKVPFVVKQDVTLVLKISFQNCQICADSVLAMLENEQAIEKPTVEVWDDNPRQSKNTTDRARGDVVYRTVQPNICKDLDSDAFNKPYLFIYNKKSMEISHVFFPDLASMGSTRKYLAVMAKKFPKPAVD